MIGGHREIGTNMGEQLTHIDAQGTMHMVSVMDKPDTARSASAYAEVVTAAENIAKGDVLAVARLAGIQAAKRADELIPLCHTLALSDVKIAFTLTDASVQIISTVQLIGRTGPEMEAMIAANLAALTIYDMCKAVDRSMEIRQAYLLCKSGGASGVWERDS
jgi:cyclic pyranopterin monophosphate synthase